MEPKIQYRVYNSPTLISVLGQINAVHGSSKWFICAPF